MTLIEYSRVRGNGFKAIQTSRTQYECVITMPSAAQSYVNGAVAIPWVGVGCVSELVHAVAK